MAFTSSVSSPRRLRPSQAASHMNTPPEGADVAFPLWVAKVTRHPLGDRPHVQAYFPKCACGETQVKSFFTKKLTTFASVERSLVAKVKMGSSNACELRTLLNPSPTHAMCPFCVVLIPLCLCRSSWSTRPKGNATRPRLPLQARAAPSGRPQRGVARGCPSRLMARPTPPPLLSPPRSTPRSPPPRPNTPGTAAPTRRGSAAN